MPRRYILVTGGDGGYGNLGDELMLRATKEFYRPYLDRFTVLIAMVNPPDGAEKGFGYLQETRESIEALRISPSDVALLHYYGGGYLNDYWYETKIRLCRHLLEAGLPPSRVAFTGQGVGPLSAERAAELGWIADGSLLFGTRDRTAAIGPAARFTFDDTISLYEHVAHATRPAPDGPLALNIRTESYVGLDDGDLDRLVTELDGYLSDRGAQGFAFGMVKSPSYDETAGVADAIGRTAARSIALRERPATDTDLAGYLSGCRATITTSYHVALYSLYVGTPVVVVHASDYYRLKFEGLAAAVNSPLLHVVAVDALDRDILDTAVASGADERSREELSDTLTGLSRTNAEAHDVIRSFLAQDAAPRGCMAVMGSLRARFSGPRTRVR